MAGYGCFQTLCIIQCLNMHSRILYALEPLKYTNFLYCLLTLFYKTVMCSTFTMYIHCTIRSFLLLRNTVKIVLGCRVCMLYARPPVGTGKSFYEVEPTETRFNTTTCDSYFLMLSNHIEMAPKSYMSLQNYFTFFISKLAAPLQGKRSFLKP